MNFDNRCASGGSVESGAVIFVEELVRGELAGTFVEAFAVNSVLAENAAGFFGFGEAVISFVDFVGDGGESRGTYFTAQMGGVDGDKNLES